MGMPLTHRRFTVDEYFRMADAGILTEDDRVELLDGEIVEKMTINPPHAGAVKQLTRLFAPWADRLTIGVQDPVILGTHSAPEPDLAILRHRGDGYRRAHPGPDDILLVIEVADSSLGHDRRRKLPLYARAHIAESWLVNLPDEVVEVYREPRKGSYTDRRIVHRGDTLTPLALPDVTLSADEILG